MAKFFNIPFAEGGDRTPIPNAEQPDGSISYVEGFGPDYSENPVTNPDARDVPRDSTNELFYEITLALQQYQSLGVPDFIEAADNDGDPFPYAKYAKVRYDDGDNGPRLFLSLENANENTPSPTDPKWLWIDNNWTQATAVQHVTFSVDVEEGDAVYWDALNSRYEQALADGSIKQQVVGFAQVALGTVVNSGVQTYQPGGLTNGSPYYLSTTTPGAITAVIPDSNITRVGIAVSTTSLFIDVLNTQDVLDSALPIGTEIVFQGTVVPPGFLEEDGTAVSRTIYAKLFTAIGVTWGPGNGSTTFNLPDARRRTSIGRGGTGTGTIGNAVGDTGGEENHVLTIPEMPAHTHEYEYVGIFAPPGLDGGGGESILPTTGTTSSTGGGGGHNTIQPSYVSLKCIKY